MTSSACPAYQVVFLDAQVASVVAGARTFLVVTFQKERVTIIFEYKVACGGRPGAYVSCRTTPPMEPEAAVSGFLFGPRDADPLAIADLEIARYRRAWGAASRELERLIKLKRPPQTKKNSRKRVLRVKRTTGKGGH